MLLLSSIHFGYIITSITLSISFLIYMAYLDICCIYKLFGHQRDRKFGLNYGKLKWVTITCSVMLLPYINLLSLIVAFYVFFYKRK